MQNARKSSFKNRPDREKRFLHDYTRYSNLAFKLIAVILAAFFMGWQIDKWLSLGFPLFTLLLSVAGIAGSLYLLIKDLQK